MSRRYSYTCWMSDEDYQSVRRSATFAHGFSRNPDTGDVKFTTGNPRRLCTDLQKLIDADATSWGEILNVPPHLAL